MIVIIINIIIFCIIGYKFKSIDNKINKIEEKLKSLEFKANFIDDKFNSFDIKDNNINNKLNYFDIKANNIEEKFKYFDTKTNYINDKFKSIDNIIYNIDDFLGVQFPIYNKKFSIFISLVKEGIMKYFYQKIKKYNLLYLASRDGFEAAHFHQKCDGKKFTVTLVITEINKIFGGFTELEWSKNNVDKNGNKGFIFSVNDNSIYYNKGNYKIYNRIWGGPSFYNGFPIQSNSGCDNTNYNNPFDVPGEEYVLAGLEKFTIKDYAVYQIEF